MTESQGLMIFSVMLRIPNGAPGTDPEDFIIAFGKMG